MSFTDEYLTYALRYTDAPPIYHQFMAYGIVAAVLRNKVWLEAGWNNLYPNLWIILLGDSSSLRKSTCLRGARDIINRIGCTIYPPEFSLERLLEILGSSPQGTFFHFEFQSLNALLSRDYMAGAKATLVDLYDCPSEYRRETKGGKALVENVCLNLFSATTFDWFVNKNTLADFRGGFLPRFLFVPAKASEKGEPKAFVPPVDQAARNELLTKLRGIAQLQGPISYAPDAKAYYEAWYGKFEKKKPFHGTPLEALHARYQDYAHKLAMILVATEGELTIRLPQAKEACHVIDSLVSRLITFGYDNFAFTPYQQERRDVLAAINRLSHNEGGWVSYEDLMKSLRMPTKRLGEILTSLIDENTLEPKTLKTGKRPKRLYRRLVSELL